MFIIHLFIKIILGRIQLIIGIFYLIKDISTDKWIVRWNNITLLV